MYNTGFQVYTPQRLIKEAKLFRLSEQVEHHFSAIYQQYTIVKFRSVCAGPNVNLIRDDC